MHTWSMGHAVCHPSTLQKAKHGGSMQHGLVHLSPARGCCELPPGQTAPWPAQLLRRRQDVLP